MDILKTANQENMSPKPEENRQTPTQTSSHISLNLEENRQILTPKPSHMSPKSEENSKPSSISPKLEESQQILIQKPSHSKETRKHEYASHTPTLPDIPSLNRRESTKEMLCHSEKTEMSTPYSIVERRVTRVRNTMQGNILRRSTKKLQDDLRQTMRTYSSEKQQLMKQLANLRHEIDEMKVSDGSISPSTFSDFSQKTTRSNKSRYFHAPDIAAQKAGKNTQRKDGNLTDRSSIPSTRTATTDLSRDGILKLPAIPGAASSFVKNNNGSNKQNSSIWYSGQNLVDKNNISQTSDPTVNLNSATEMMRENYPIPKINDPMRNDITLGRNKPKVKDKKRVHFANFHTLNTVKYSNVSSSEHPYKENNPKNLKAGEVDNLPQVQKNQKKYSHKGYKKFRPYDKAYVKLPPIDEVKLGFYNTESQHTAENYKAMYVSIINPEERMKTLADILYAVRMRMQENEQNIKYGESPRYGKTDSTLCDFLLKNNQDKMAESRVSPGSDITKQLKQHKGIPNNTAARMGRRSTGTQLQNYLRKMSRSRRMIEHMQVEEMRLAHMGHQHLLTASQA